MIQVTLQNPSEAIADTSIELLSQWVNTAWQSPSEGEVVIRYVDKAEMQALNATYRQRDYPTNVLSFPAPALPFVAAMEEAIPLGDMVICTDVITEEAITQGKTQTQHLAHMVVHSALHLQGYDHIEADEAQQMEQLEVKTLALMGYPDPYLET